MNSNRMTALIVGLAVALVLTLGFAVSHSLADSPAGSYNGQGTSAPSATGPAKSLNAVAHAAGETTSGNSTAGTSPTTTSSHDPGLPCRSNALSKKCP